MPWDATRARGLRRKRKCSAVLWAEQMRIAVRPVKARVARYAVPAGTMGYLIRVTGETEPTSGELQKVSVWRAVGLVAIKAPVAQASGYGAVLEDVWAALLLVALAALPPNLLGVAHGKRLAPVQIMAIGALHPALAHHGVMAVEREFSRLLPVAVDAQLRLGLLEVCGSCAFRQVVTLVAVNAGSAVLASGPFVLAELLLMALHAHRAELHGLQLAQLCHFRPVNGVIGMCLRRPVAPLAVPAPLSPLQAKETLAVKNAPLVSVAPRVARAAHLTSGEATRLQRFRRRLDAIGSASQWL